MTANETNSSATDASMLDIESILAALPHRYPFLLVDRVLNYQLEPEPRLQAIKNVSFNEPFFQGHFPGHPVMPGVLLIEAMAQAAGVLTQLKQRAIGKESPLFYLVKVDNARFSRIIRPGDQLLLQVEEKRVIRSMAQYLGSVTVDGEKAASAEFLCAERR